MVHADRVADLVQKLGDEDVATVVHPDESVTGRRAQRAVECVTGEVVFGEERVETADGDNAV